MKIANVLRDILQQLDFKFTIKVETTLYNKFNQMIFAFVHL